MRINVPEESVMIASADKSEPLTWNNPLEGLWVVGDQSIERWIQGGTEVTTLRPDGSSSIRFIPDEE
jgi:hypothetical protein